MSVSSNDISDEPTPTSSQHEKRSNDPVEDGGNESGTGGSRPEVEEASILDVLLALADNLNVILWTTGLFVTLGLAVALLKPDTYTAEASVVRETQSGAPQLPGGIASLQGLGINLGMAAEGLGREAFPTVLHSREVKAAVVRDTLPFPEAGPMTYLAYANREPSLLDIVLKYTNKLPNLLTDDSKDDPAKDSAATMPTREENRAIGALSEKLSSSIDNESGLMKIRATTSSPLLSTRIVEGFVSHLTTRVREIRTRKVKARLEFVESRFREAGEELEAAEENLAEFLERNQNPTDANLRFRRDRLQRQVRFKEQLYSELQGQLTQSRLDLQRQQPVVTVVENPTPPSRPDGPSGFLILAFSGLVGWALGVGISLVRIYFANVRDEEQWKVKQIMQKLAATTGLGSRRVPGDEVAEEPSDDATVAH